MGTQTRLIEDATGRKKLHVTLPGGRYQLSLDDRAVNLLCNDLGYGLGDAVPEPYVPVLVATGDAWFPRQRDVESVIEDLPADGSLTGRERTTLVDYLTAIRITPRNERLVKDVVAASPVAEVVAPDDLQINSLPSIPDGIDMGATSTETTTETASVRADTASDTTSTADDVDTTSETETAADATSTAPIDEIHGIGETRAAVLREGGYTTPEQIAAARPADLAELSGISEQLATVAVEGARELLGFDEPTAARLASETGVDESEFDAALAALAASGIPPSEAAPELRVLYGPSITDVASVTGQQAYYLWNAGYRTPTEIADATVDDLCAVPYVGEKTAVSIRDDARALRQSAE